MRITSLVLILAACGNEPLGTEETTTTTTPSPTTTEVITDDEICDRLDNDGDVAIDDGSCGGGMPSVVGVVSE